MFEEYLDKLTNSTLVRHAITPLTAERRNDDSQDYLVILGFFLSLSETSQQTTALSPFIYSCVACLPVLLRYDVNFLFSRSDHWILHLLPYCPPDANLYAILGPICTAPLPQLPIRAVDTSDELVAQFLEQTEAFNKYAEVCLFYSLGPRSVFKISF